MKYNAFFRIVGYYYFEAKELGRYEDISSELLFLRIIKNRKLKTGLSD